MRIAAITLARILLNPVIHQHIAERRLPGPQSLMPALMPEQFFWPAACLHSKTAH